MTHDEQRCKHLLGSLSDYIDGCLEQSLCDEIDRHLSGCNNCRIVVDTLRKTVYLLHNNSDPREIVLPEDVRHRLFHALDLDEYLQKSDS